MDVKIEETILKQYKLLKRLNTGVFEIVIDNYTIRLHTKSESNRVSLIRDNLDLNIPNKFIDNNREEAIKFFTNVIDAVYGMVNSENSLSKDTEDSINNKYLNLPKLELTNKYYFQFIEGDLYYVS